MLKKLIKTVGKTFSNVVNDKHSSLAMYFVWHYLNGTQNNMTLPKDAVLYLRSELISAIEDRLDYPSYNTLISYSPETDSEFTNFTIPDWLGMKGVVGAYEFKVHGIQNDHLLISCKDTWDFNQTGTHLSADVKSEKLAKLIKKLAKQKGVEINVTGSVISTSEESLMTLNEKHSFTTKWKDCISLTQFNAEHQEKLKNISDWQFLLTKEEVDNYALDNAIKRLAGFISGNEFYLYRSGPDLRLPKTWEMVNKVRKLSNENNVNKESISRLID